MQWRAGGFSVGIYGIGNFAVSRVRVLRCRFLFKILLDTWKWHQIVTWLHHSLPSWTCSVMFSSDFSQLSWYLQIDKGDISMVCPWSCSKTSHDLDPSRTCSHQFALFHNWPCVHINMYTLTSTKHKDICGVDWAVLSLCSSSICWPLCLCYHELRGHYFACARTLKHLFSLTTAWVTRLLLFKL